jgi:DNA-directed RNA polymerase beta' subunit
MVEDTDSKRVNFSARTVIGADPTLKLNQLGIPIEVAKIHTKPETVTPYNIKWLTDIVNAGEANFLITTKKREDGTDVTTRINLQYAMFRKGTELLYGDIIVKNGANPQDIKLLDEKEWEGRFIKVKTGKETLQFGDKLVRNGKLVEDIQYPTKKNITLKIGDVVERQLRAGDALLLNRQPLAKI